MPIYFFDLILIVLGLSGFILASHIWHKKTKKRPLICPLRSNCDAVISSKYSKFLGIPVEILGMIYYAFITIVHFIFLIMPELLPEQVLYVSIIASVGAFIFSIYLISVQAFILKEWCVWCLTSAFLCVLIFFTTYISIGGHFPALVI